MLLEWVKRNQSLAFKITGANFLVMAFVLLFWSQPKVGMSENEKAAANVARMEGRSGGTDEIKQMNAEKSANFMKEYQENQKANLRIVLIIMAALGTGFLAYGFIKKP